jgi:hypothetical protein
MATQPTAQPTRATLPKRRTLGFLHYSLSKEMEARQHGSDT